MATLGIKGNYTNCKEVIQLLEMLGGVNYYNLEGSVDSYCYYIDDNNKIWSCLSTYAENIIVYTLEEFIDKFPYKVGDKVIYDYERREITKMVWEEQTNTIAYKLDDKLYCNVIDDLQPYEEEYYCQVIGNDTSNNGVNTSASSIDEETMEDKDEKVVNHVFDTDVISFDIAQKDKYELDLQGKFEVVLQEGKYYVKRIKPQYPKDYEECCEVLVGRKPTPNEISFDKMELCLFDVNNNESMDLLPPQLSQLNGLFRLLMCRNAYWKLAGDEMGLDKPWKPDWDNLSTTHEFIKINKGCFTYSSRVLVFPTLEMRDAFYDNFKGLIEQCKELL